ncbi:FG-GAP repeat domain-containing protein [Gloeobacter violaceus]|uniref:FG-GAP repeat domain-containing protein n=1 Tax=Gloeobacter violaceus TaxID=33072 RepID=UPI0013E89FB2|nr:VCBS repeat-containing protein [Gloeobacter violaceus]
MPLRRSRLLQLLILLTVALVGILGRPALAGTTEQVFAPHQPANLPYSLGKQRAPMDAVSALLGAPDGFKRPAASGVRLAQAVPANDNFAQREVLGGVPASTTGTNVGATKEPGEPDHNNNSGGASVWYTWTAPTSGSYIINTSGSNFDTILAVYTGSDVAALTFVASDDDSGGLGTSQVIFAAVAGTVYQIAVDGFSGSTGSIVLSLAEQLPPANDDFADRETISGASASVTGTNVGATKEPGEPDHGGNGGGASVWYTWTAPTSGSVFLDTCPSFFSTVLAVYTGDSVSALTPVSQLSSCQQTLSVLAGTTYQIAVDGFNFGSGPSTGTINLNLSFSEPPTNDDFADRETISGTAATVMGTNVAATKEPGEPDHGGNVGGASIWYTWTAPSTGTASLNTCSSFFSVLLGVYTGNAVSALTPIASIGSCQLSFSAAAGTTYQIAVDGFNFGSGPSTGTINLNLSFSEPPTNDDFADRETISGKSPSVSGSNFGATKEPGEPDIAFIPGGASVWYTWTAPQSGEVIVNVCNSSFDTVHAVYTGASVSALTFVAGSDFCEFSFSAVAGTAYQIAVDGFFGSTGTFTLALTLAPPNDDFAAATVIPSKRQPLLYVQRAGNEGATKEFDEPEHAANPGGKSLWWTWTAATTGPVSVSTKGSNFNTLLAVYKGDLLSSLILVAANDDLPTRPQSGVTFTAVAGNTYKIAVDGSSVDFGTAASGRVLFSLISQTQSLATSDMNGDGKADRLVRNHQSGTNSLQLMDGDRVVRTVALPTLGEGLWLAGATGDFNGDGHRDIFWRNHATGENGVWLMKGTRRLSTVVLPPLGDLQWQMAGTGDFNGDRKLDIVWRHPDAAKGFVWLMDGTKVLKALPTHLFTRK